MGLSFSLRLDQGDEKDPVSALRSERGLGLELDDLSSRLSAGLIYQLQPLSDADKHAALHELAARRGM